MTKKRTFILSLLIKVGYIIGLLFLIVLSFLPLKIGYLFSDLFTSIAVRKERATRTTKRNLRRAFPDWSPKKVDTICRAYFKVCIDYLFEFLRFSHFSQKEILKRCTFHNVDLLKDALMEHRFVICYAGHMLNYEFLTSLPLHIKGYGMCHIFLADKPNIIQDWILKTRAKYGAVNIPSYNPLRTIVQINKDLNEGNTIFSGYVLGTLADMDTKEKNPHTSKFFGHDMEMLTGSERIGRKYNMDFFFAQITRPHRGYYDVTFIKINPTTDPAVNGYAYTDEFVKLLENNIRVQPEIWMQWGTPRF